MSWWLLVVGVAACGSKEPCDVSAQTGCGSDEVCEPVGTTEETICASPVVIEGTVFELLGVDQPGIDDARVVTVDENGAAASAVAVSDVDGHYRVTVPVPRDADGRPLAAKVTLRADAAGFLSFPSGIRQAIPIDLTTAVEEDGAWRIDSTQTAIGLLPFPGGGATGTLRGTAAVPEGRTGVLVVAEQGGVGRSVIADVDGDYAIFNVPAGEHHVSAYAAGLVHTPVTVTLTAGQTATADLAADDTQATVAVSGNVTFVNPGSGLTSVVLVVASTFDDTLLRGDVPPGLRAPGPGVAPDVAGGFRIEAVPPGRYVVLAGFENDGFVRDPDTGIGGTEIVHIEVGQVDLALDQSFKVTGAMELFGPGAEAPEALAAPPLLEWANDPSAKEYRVTVIDALGEITLETTVADGSGDRQSLAYTGAFEPGVFYQVRVVSVDGEGTPLSSTEDLRGVFQAEVP
jgi:hypothetical protein